jgi:hypothetical protein
MVEESKRVNILIPCACGQCDLMIWKFDEHNGWKERKYARGHATKGKPHSEQHKQNITKAKMGHPVSKETREKLRKFFKGKPISKEHKQNIGKSKTGDKNAMWKGGKYLDSYGYYKVWAPTHPFKDYWGYVFEHRLVMEKHIGRYLPRDKLVHHINEIKTDNRIENLQVMTRIEHSKYHWKKERNLLVPIIKDLCR